MVGVAAGGGVWDLREKNVTLGDPWGARRRPYQAESHGPCAWLVC